MFAKKMRKILDHNHGSLELNNATRDPGFSQLFVSRISEFAGRSGVSANESDDRRKRPDRVLGLQGTEIFRKYLGRIYAHDKSTKLVEDVIDIKLPNQRPGAPLLFPFLILEAKAEANKGVTSAEIQTLFPIRNALELQYKLMKTPGNRYDTLGGPLLWFLFNAATYWRVYGAIVREENNVPHYVSWL